MNITEHAPDCIVSILDDADESDCTCDAYSDYLNAPPDFCPLHGTMLPCTMPDCPYGKEGI